MLANQYVICKMAPDQKSWEYWVQDSSEPLIMQSGVPGSPPNSTKNSTSGASTGTAIGVILATVSLGT